MSEFELLTLQLYYKELVSSNIMNFISILSGFLLANHFLGQKINTIQFTIMLLTYTVVMLVTGVGIQDAIAELYSAERALAEMSRTWSTNQTGEQTLPINVTLILTYIGSIYFAFTTRKQQS